MGRQSFRPLRVIQRHVFVGIPVRPAVHGNRANIGLVMEAVLTEHALKLITNLLLISVKVRRIHFMARHATQLSTVFGAGYRKVRDPEQEYHHRIIRTARRLVPTCRRGRRDGHHDVWVIGAAHTAHSKFRPGMPVL